MSNESKSDRFRRLARPRVDKATKALRLVGNLGNKSLYEMSDKERRVIIKHLKNAFNDMERNLQHKSKKEAEGFDFE